jgi:hypothetical protein
MSGRRTEITKRVRTTVREPVWTVTNALLRPTAPLRVLPAYLLIGGQRCGTTSLQGVLGEHPNLTSARLMKGVHYFDTAYHRGLPWYQTHFPTKTYAEWIERRTGAPLLAGEASPYYLFHPLALERIRADLPGVKLVALLRDPVERTISHHKHEVRRNNEPLGLEAALAMEQARLAGEAERIVAEAPTYNSFPHQTFSYVARSRYAGQVRRLFDLFDRGSVLILQSEAFFTDPESVYTRVLDFLGVPRWLPDQFPRANATPDASVPEPVRSRLVAQFRDANEELFHLLGERFAWQ